MNKPEQRLVDANALLEDFKGKSALSLDYAVVKINDAPTVEAVEVAHGQWQKMSNAYAAIEGWIHEDCGRMTTEASPYCPSCGARMDAQEVEG